MDINIQKRIVLLLEKSQTSYLLAIEIYNKPFLIHRIDYFSYLICNAWELLLKAHLLNIGESIYYSDKANSNRTIALSDCIRKVMTNDKDPVRKNLELVVGVRNKAAHLLVPEYANILHDFFVSCCKNYTVKLTSLFNISITDKLPGNFIILFNPSFSKSESIANKYDGDISEQFQSMDTYLSKIMAENSNNGNVNSDLAVSYELTFKRSNKAEEADITTGKGPYSEQNRTEFIREVDNGKLYTLGAQSVKDSVNEELKKNGLFFYKREATTNIFTSRMFIDYVKYFDLKNNPDYTRVIHLGNSDEHPQFRYKPAIVELIIQSITNDPYILDKIRLSFRNKKD